MPRAAPTERKTKTAEPKEKVARAPSAYNAYMKIHLPKLKAENPELSHKDAFKKVASNWKDAKENPANKK